MKEVQTKTLKDRVEIYVEGEFIGSLFFRKSDNQLYWKVQLPNKEPENWLCTMKKATEEIFKNAFPGYWYSEFHTYFEVDYNEA